MKDVAAQAGVSAMTVSYAFNHPGRVADSTRRRVLEVADRLGYRPDRTARALRSGRSGQLGVVLGEHLSYAFDDPRAAQFLAGVADVCVEDGLGMVLIPTVGDDGDVDRVRDAAVDAYVLWTTTEDDPVLAAVTASGRPAAVQGGPARPGIARVGPDDRAAAAAVATAALAGGGDPVVVSFPLDRSRTALVGRAADLPAHVPFPVTRDRLAGYRDAVTATGRDWATVPVAVVERNERARGAWAARALGVGAGAVVLAMSDELALGVHAELPRRPARIAGWDASAAALAAGVVSVTNPLRAQGRACARAALDPSAAVPEVAWEVVGELARETSPGPP